MLFKRKAKRSKWMEGLLLAERLHKDCFFDYKAMKKFYYCEVSVKGNDSMFKAGFLDYLDRLLDYKHAL